MICSKLAQHLFVFRNYDVLDQEVWAVALCRELPSLAWRGVFAAVIKVPLARSASQVKRRAFT